MRPTLIAPISCILLLCLLAVAPLAASTAYISDEAFFPVGPVPGVQGRVNAILKASDGNIYVGGEFTQVGSGLAGTANIARWNGTAWESLGGNATGPVHALVEKTGKVYVGGEFHAIGGIGAERLAAFDLNAETWEEVGGGRDSYVFALAAFADNRIAVGGNFTGQVAILDLDSGIWTPVIAELQEGSGGNTWVKAVATRPNGDLYFAGEFLHPTDLVSLNIGLRTADGVLHQVPDNFNPPKSGTIACLAWDAVNELLWTGGPFTQVAGGAGNYLAYFYPTGAEWTPPGDLCTADDGGVFALASDGRYYYAGGTFLNASGMADADHLAVMDSNDFSWASVGAGVAKPIRIGQPQVAAIHMDGSDPIVGGNFCLPFETGQSAASAACTVRSVGGLARRSGGGWQGFGADTRCSTDNVVSDGQGGLYVRAFSGTGINPAFRGASYASPIDDGTRSYLIAHWDGEAWDDLLCPAGNYDGDEAADSLVAISDGFAGSDGGHLYVGLTYRGSSSGTDVHTVCEWNGIGWNRLAGFFDAPPSALAVCDGVLVAVGAFAGIDGNEDGDVADPGEDIARVAKYDPNAHQWLPVGDPAALVGFGALGSRAAVASDGTNLYVVLNDGDPTQEATSGQLFRLPTWASVSAAAAWNQVAATDGYGVCSLAITADDAVWLGGCFQSVQGVAADSLARCTFNSDFAIMDVDPGLGDPDDDGQPGDQGTVWGLSAAGNSVILTGLFDFADATTGETLKGMGLCDGDDYFAFNIGSLESTTCRRDRTLLADGRLYLTGDFNQLGYYVYAPRFAGIDLRQPAPTLSGPSGAITDDTPAWSWTHDASYGDGQYRYRIDGGAWTATDQLTVTVESLGDGAHTFEVAEQHVSGGWYSLPASAAVTIDATPPGAPEVGAVSPTKDSTPLWSWSSGGGGAGTFRYRLDAGDWSGDTGVTSVSPGSALSDGNHTLYVKERDAAGNWSAEGSATVLVDTVPPGTPVVSGPSATKGTTPTWTWVSGGGAGTNLWRYRLDDAAWVGSDELAFTASPLAEGAHVLLVQQRDLAGNWSASGSLTISVDLTPPAAPVVSAASPTADTTPRWTWTGGGGGNGSFRYSLDDDAWVATAGTAFTAPVLAAGSHKLEVQERDAAGNWSAIAVRTVMVDTTPPAKPVVTATSITNDPTPTWTWVSGGNGGNGTFRRRLDGGAWSETTKLTFTAATLAAGSHKLEVQERDAAGTWSASGSRTVQIDLTPPAAPTVTGPASTTDRTPTWTWTSGGGGGNGTFRYRLDGGTWKETAKLAFTPAANLTIASHKLEVQERDAAGNWSAAGSKTVKVTAAAAPEEPALPDGDG
jgi:hypothetical protein